MKRIELGCCFGDLKRLVVGQRQIELEPRRHVGGRDVQGSPVLIDSLLVAAELGQDSTQVGTRLDPFRVGCDAGPVFANGSREISRLMQLNRTIEGALGVQDRCRCGTE